MARKSLFLVFVTLLFSLRALAETERFECNKPPLPGPPGFEASDEGLKFQGYLDASRFLQRLSQYSYSFDARYLSLAAKIIEKSEAPDLASLFVMSALVPYLKAFGYVEIKRRYVDSALENLFCLNSYAGIEGLSSLKHMGTFQEITAKLLLHSLETSRPLLDDSQRARAEGYIRSWGDLLAKGLGSEALATISAQAPGLASLLQELAVSSYLRGRAASDLELLSYLVEK